MDISDPNKIQVADGQAYVVIDNEWLTPSSARWYARRILQAAEQAENGVLPTRERRFGGSTGTIN